MVKTASPFLYDRFGPGYELRRRPDERIVAILHAGLGNAESVLNVGAGAGAYEPSDRLVIAAEPSVSMLALRDPDAAPAVRARAEALPFDDRCVDAVLAVLTVHHWADQTAGLRECARVARERIVILTWDPASEGFWLVRDYLPAFLDLDRVQFPSIETIGAVFGPHVHLEISGVPIPSDCTDGFLGAYWCRPSAYLDAQVRAGISSFARQRAPDIANTETTLARLAADLASGAWEKRYGFLRGYKTLDIGYRVVVAHVGG